MDAFGRLYFRGPETPDNQAGQNGCGRNAAAAIEFVSMRETIPGRKEQFFIRVWASPVDRPMTAVTIR